MLCSTHTNQKSAKKYLRLAFKVHYYGIDKICCNSKKYTVTVISLTIGLELSLTTYFEVYRVFY